MASTMVSGLFSAAAGITADRCVILPKVEVLLLRQNRKPFVAGGYRIYRSAWAQAGQQQQQSACECEFWVVGYFPTKRDDNINDLHPYPYDLSADRSHRSPDRRLGRASVEVLVGSETTLGVHVLDYLYQVSSVIRVGYMPVTVCQCVLPRSPCLIFFEVSVQRYPILASLFRIIGCPSCTNGIVYMRKVSLPSYGVLAVL